MRFRRRHGRPGTDKADKISRDLRLKGQALAVKRMYKRNRMRKKRQTLVGGIALAVFVITGHRMPQVGQMDADLVFPAGQKVDAQQAEFIGLFDHGIGGVGQFAFGAVGGRTHAIVLIFDEMAGDRPCLLREPSVDDRVIYLLGRAPIIF